MPSTAEGMGVRRADLQLHRSGSLEPRHAGRRWCIGGADDLHCLRAGFVGFASGVSSTSCSGLKSVGRWEELSGGNLFRELCCFSRSHDRTILETKADSETALPVMGREAPGFERR